MQCVLLLGGFGTRLGSLTKDLPKPLVPIMGRPFLDYLLDLLIRSGFKDFLFLNAYHSDLIVKRYTNSYARGITFEHSNEVIPMGTGGALYHAQKFLDNRFIMVNGDTFLPMDYYAFIQEVNQNSKQYIVGTKNLTSDEKYNISVKSDLLVESIGSKDSSYIDSGVYCFDSYFFKEKYAEFPFSLSCAYPKMISQSKLYLYETKTQYFDIGTPARLVVFQKYLESL
jgi:NDP-sugar pyrophosphorylase family protein